MTLLEIGRIASRYETKIAHEMLCAVARAMYDETRTFPVSEVSADDEEPEEGAGL